jgi:cytochrome bd-type quinol oxidase subunit 1
LGFPTGWSFTTHQANFLAPLPGKSGRPLQGEFFARTSFTLLSFALLYFYLHRFIKNTKKLVPSIIVIFIGLLLSCFIMLSINGWFL